MDQGAAASLCVGQKHHNLRRAVQVGRRRSFEATGSQSRDLTSGVMTEHPELWSPLKKFRSELLGVHQPAALVPCNVSCLTLEP